MTTHPTGLDSLLDPYRVLDLTDAEGQIGPMVLADLGADVILVEPPGGSVARSEQPVVGTSSLPFTAYNRNKRSIALDSGSDGDRSVFEDLVRSADIVMDSGVPGRVATSFGMDFAALSAINPRITQVRVTAHGATGPRAEQPATDLTIAALGGSMALQGPADRPPVRISTPQVWRHTGVEAAVAAVLGLHRARRTGRAQEIDVSAQAVIVWTLLNGMTAGPLQGFDFERNGSYLQAARQLDPIFDCADGKALIVPTGQAMTGLAPALIDAGCAPEEWATIDWMEFDMARVRGEVPTPLFEDVTDALSAYLSTIKKADLVPLGLDSGVTIVPVNNVADLVDNEHCRVRSVWRELQVNGQPVQAAGPWIHLDSEPASSTIRSEAPALDEHGPEIRASLEGSASRTERVASAENEGIDWPSEDPDLTFAGLKVVDFSWVGVGPITAKFFADHGATVVRVESETRPDVLRGLGPLKDNIAGSERSNFFGEFNTSKRSIALDLKNPTGVELAKKLIAWADVYIESFTPGAVDRIGIGYETASELNPSIVMVSTCLMGQTGPSAALAGYGYHASSVAGCHEVTGYADDGPSGPWMAYTDTIAPRFLQTTVMAAIERRRRTGQGAHFDAAQFEMAMQFQAPEILDYGTTGHVAGRIGNRSRFTAPQGAYPAAGDDQWVTISIETDDQWRALVTELGSPEWATSADLDTAEGRLAHHDLIDEELGSWTGPQDRFTVMDRLAAAGVPSGVVLRSSEFPDDPQHQHRGFHHWLEHAECGPVIYSGHTYRISGLDHGPRTAAPLLGQHSYEVLTELLGMPEEQVIEAITEGAIT